MILLIETVALISCDPHSLDIDDLSTAGNPNAGVMTTRCSNRITVWRTPNQPDQYLIEHLVNSTTEKCHNELLCHHKSDQGDALAKGDSSRSLSEDSSRRKDDSLIKDDSQSENFPKKDDSSSKGDILDKHDYLTENDSLNGNRDSLSKIENEDSLIKDSLKEGDDSLDKEKDVKEPCKCKTSNETFYAREIDCKYGFDQGTRKETYFGEFLICLSLIM